MDDFNLSSLHESKNEWSARLVTILTPLVIDGYKSILDEAIKLCKENKEMDKYLMTFQNFISRVPKWNPAIIEAEKKRICDKSHLVTCVHIIQLKVLTAMRVGQKQKKIDINIPKLDDFIHKIYINVARKVYKNTYLFEIGIPPLQMQKHNRELEVIVQECILNTLRESIPVEAILKAYMDETIEEDVTEEIKEEYIDEVPKNGGSLSQEQVQNQTINDDVIKQNTNMNSESKLRFNDTDYTRDINNNESSINSPKSIEHLELLNRQRAEQRRLEDDDDDDNVKLNISNQSVSLSDFDVHVMDEPKIELFPELLIDDIEVLN